MGPRGGRARSAVRFAAVCLSLVIAAVVAFVACPGSSTQPKTFAIAPCGPMEEVVDVSLFQIGTSNVPNTPVGPDFYTAWLLGAARPDCPAEASFTVEPFPRSAQTIPTGVFEAKLSTSCFQPPSSEASVAVAVSQPDARTVQGRGAVTGAPACADDQHRRAMELLGAPYAPMTMQMLVRVAPDAPKLDRLYTLVGSTTFRYVPFESWSVAPSDAADAGAPSVVPSVRIVSPLHHAIVRNPVTVRVTARNVAKVQVYADTFKLGDAFDPTVQQETAPRNFSQYGDRVLRAAGLDAAGKEVASHSILVTLVKDMMVAPTYFYVATESEYGAGSDRTLYDTSCTPLRTGAGDLKLSTEFFDAVCIEGTGKTDAGVLFNYVRDCDACAPNTPCPQLSNELGPRRKCWELLSTDYDWGKAATTRCVAHKPDGGCGLVPLVSWAVDKSVIDLGTVIYAPKYDGATITASGGIPAGTLDGCFRADDTGKKIEKAHVDVFAGTNGVRLQLERVQASSPEPYDPVIDAVLYHPKCAYLAVP